MGAGDVKLMAALGLASGPLYLLGTFIAAGLCSLLWLLVLRLWPQQNKHLIPPWQGALGGGQKNTLLPPLSWLEWS